MKLTTKMLRRMIKEEISRINEMGEGVDAKLIYDAGEGLMPTEADVAQWAEDNAWLLDDDPNNIWDMADELVAAGKLQWTDENGLMAPPKPADG